MLKLLLLLLLLLPGVCCSVNTARIRYSLLLLTHSCRSPRRCPLLLPQQRPLSPPPRTATGDTLEQSSTVQ
eukprot:COSAG01_NODE_56_length_31088_cov_39.354771_2_plen_71_part_00